MNNPLINATIIRTGEKIQVYLANDATYVDYTDCNTSYKKHELKLPKKKQ